ncbi:MAG: sugar ABC transporter permease [Phycisphaerales bacterium]|nr:sugar ABC transporter permease [Phycisphaerales bacterium]
MTLRRSINAYAYIAFPVAILTVFSLAPTVLGFALSFFQWDGGGAPVFVGLRNFQALLDDHRFGPALINTLVYVIASVPPAVLIAFLLAVAVHAKWFRGKALVRTLLFMPTIVSIVAIGFVWRWVLDDQTGLLNWVLSPVYSILGVTDRPDWLNEGRWPMVWVIIISVWRNIGFCLVLYLAALASVDDALYEAAELDGAGRWSCVRHVTWPQVAPMTVFLIVTGVISALQVFDIVFVMSGRQVGPNVSVLNYEIYNQFKGGQLGYAAAIGVVIFIITALATAGQLGLSARRQRAGSTRTAAAKVVERVHA